MDVNNSGELIKCDFVIVNTGTQQNCEFTRNAGNTCGKGINVNGIMDTRFPGILVAGNVVFFNDVNQGLWAPSFEMGKMPALILLVVINYSNSHQNLCH